MSRWNIEKLLLFSHDGRRRDINFDIGSINIITGKSHTGKSAITEIIDYVMGASACHIPTYVRNCCTWVGLLWIKEQTCCLICRKIPVRNAKSSGEVHYEVGININIPTSFNDLRSDFTNVDDSNKKFEQLLGIGEVKSEVFNSPTRSPVRISVRNVMPYILQDDTIIINKNNLLRGSDNERKMSIIDTLPYFLGAIDESFLEKEHLLKRLRTKLSGYEKKKQEFDRLNNANPGLARELLIEAVQVGLIEKEPLNIVSLAHDIIIELLIKAESQSVSDSRGKINNESYNKLYEEDKQITRLISEKRREIESTEQLLSIAKGFNDSVNIQQRRLAAVDLMPRNEGNNLCPLCCQDVKQNLASIEDIKKVLKRVNEELNNVERERPKLDEYLQKLKADLQLFIEERKIIRHEISLIVKENEAIQKGIELEHLQLITKGRIGLYLQSLSRDKKEFDLVEFEKLKLQIDALEQEMSKETKLELLENVRLRLSTIATNILAELPFESRYRNCTVDFNLRNLSVGLITPYRREEMRDIGSDENYLSLHLAVMLALHRHFSELDRPVPGVLLLDQLSRPFFPPDPSGELDEIVIAEQTEKEELWKYFEFLFKEVQKQKSLQLIILEHAYFQKHPEFVKSTKERWNKEGLIPTDWPEII